MPEAPAHKLTDKQIGTYLVYRMKMNELIHLNFLFHQLRKGGCGDTVYGVAPEIVSGTVRTCAMAWFITMLDRNGVNIFDLWKKMFPQYTKRLNLYRNAIEKDLVRIRAFRNRSAFHAEPVFQEFFKPRVEMQDHAEEDVRTLRRFLKLATFLLRREHTVDPNLQSRILGVILDAELSLKCRIRRGWFIETNILDRSSVFGSWKILNRAHSPGKHPEDAYP